MIKQRGSKYILVSSSGRTLGVHRSRAAAQRQEQAIKASQSRRKK